MQNIQKTKHVGSQDYYAQQMTKIHNKYYNIIGLQTFLTKIVFGISVLASRKETLNLIQVVSPLRLGKILTTAMHAVY